jgi:hypothetical protein
MASYLWMILNDAKFAHVDSVLETKLIGHPPLWTLTQPHRCRQARQTYENRRPFSIKLLFICCWCTVRVCIARRPFAALAVKGSNQFSKNKDNQQSSLL